MNQLHLRQRDPVSYRCLGCKRTFKTQFRRIKASGNWCVSCRVKLSNSRRTYPPLSQAHKDLLAAAHRGKHSYWRGKKMTVTHRKHLSEAKKGKPTWNKGKHLVPPEHRRLREAIHDCCAGMVRRVLKLKHEEKALKTFEHLGYSKSQFVAHISSQFQDGMSWSNYGEWQIDHIVPVYCFVKSGILDVRVINALSNLQPLWKRDNLRKGSKFRLATP